MYDKEHTFDSAGALFSIFWNVTISIPIFYKKKFLCSFNNYELPSRFGFLFETSKNLWHHVIDLQAVLNWVLSARAQQAALGGGGGSSQGGGGH